LPISFHYWTDGKLSLSRAADRSKPVMRLARSRRLPLRNEHNQCTLVITLDAVQDGVAWLD